MVNITRWGVIFTIYTCIFAGCNLHMHKWWGVNITPQHLHAGV